MTEGAGYGLFMLVLGGLVLLFRMGLESDLDRLIGRLRRAVAACIFGPGMVSRLLGYEARRGKGAK